jgi:hypothetical protein
MTRPSVQRISAFESQLLIRQLLDRAEVCTAEVGGADKGPISGAKGTSERREKPSVTRSLNRLLPASVLSRVRAPSPVVPAMHSVILMEYMASQ